MRVRVWKFDATPKEITITFRGHGQSGCVRHFTRRTHWREYGQHRCTWRCGLRIPNVRTKRCLHAMYSDLDVKLLILQYGGNVLPNLKDAEEAAQYGRFFGAQIARFKKMIPGVSIIVIGPSDMSIKDGEHYVTRPYLEEVRDAMKTNALAQGAVFWDMYAAMGGRNSMVSWVEADPPLAATDYTHFSPQGAKKVAELFYTALINDFAAYYASNH